MVKVLIVSPYYNNSHFLEVQLQSFRKYLKNCSWKLVVVDDSNENTVNYLTKEKEDIQTVCKRYECEVDYIKFTGNDTSTPGLRKHQNVLKFIMKDVSQMYKDKFDYLFSLDADMCFVKSFDCALELEGYDIIGPKRIQSLNNHQLSPDCLVFTFFWVHCCFFNLKTITNFETINFHEIPGTTADTGSMMIEFLTNNPQYKLKYLNFSDGSSLQTFYLFDTFYNNTFLHFGSGSQWCPSKESSYHDLFKTFKQKVYYGLTAEDENTIEEEKIKVIYPKYKKFLERNVATKEHMRQYGLRV